MVGDDLLFECPKCGSTKIVKAGFRKLKSEWRQRYRCKDCGRRFIITPFPAIRFKSEVVHLAIMLLNKGVKRVDVRDILKKMYGAKVSLTTLYSWRQKFGRIRKIHRWKKLPDGSRICVFCGLKLSEKEFKKGKYPSCPKRTRNPKEIASKYLTECVRPQWALELQEEDV